MWTLADQKLSAYVFSENRSSEVPFKILKSPLGKAIKYTLNQWEALTQFLATPIVPLDNNHAERLLRRVALARKTHMFTSADRGESYAVVLSLGQFCRLCGLNPEEYLSDVLLKGQTTPMSEVRSLLPTQWQSSTDRISHAWA